MHRYNTGQYHKTRLNNNILNWEIALVEMRIPKRVPPHKNHKNSSRKRRNEIGDLTNEVIL